MLCTNIIPIKEYVFLNNEVSISKIKTEISFHATANIYGDINKGININNLNTFLYFISDLYNENPRAMPINVEIKATIPEIAKLLSNSINKSVLIEAILSDKLLSKKVNTTMFNTGKTNKNNTGKSTIVYSKLDDMDLLWLIINIYLQPKLSNILEYFQAFRLFYYNLYSSA